MLLENKNAFGREGISISQLRAALNGRVIAPEDAGYDEARTIFYGGFDRRPAVIVRPSDATEVARVVSLAREPVGDGRRPCPGSRGLPRRRPAHDQPPGTALPRGPRRPSQRV